MNPVNIPIHSVPNIQSIKPIIHTTNGNSIKPPSMEINANGNYLNFI